MTDESVSTFTHVEVDYCHKVDSYFILYSYSNLHITLYLENAVINLQCFKNLVYMKLAKKQKCWQCAFVSSFTLTSEPHTLPTPPPTPCLHPLGPWFEKT